MAEMPPPTRRISITAALVFNVALLAIVIGALCAWLITLWGTEDIQLHERERLAATARGIARQITMQLDERQADVRAARDLFERELAGASTQQKREVLERTRASFKHFSWMGVVAPDGEIQIGTGHLLEGVSVAGRNWFDGALKTPIFFGNLHPAKLLEPYLHNPDGTPLYLLDIALPLHGSDGKVVGVVGSHLNWKMIEDSVRQGLETGSGGSQLSAAIVTTDGTLLYDTQGAAGTVAGLLKLLEAEPMIEASWLAEQETSFLVAAPTPPVQSITGLDWRIVVREAAPAVRAGIAQMEGKIFVGSILAGLLFSLLGVLAVRAVTHPLQTLVRDITRFGETEKILPEPAVNERIVEVADLRESFQKMAANVVAHNELLEESQLQIIRTLARAGEFRDNETGNHVSRMSLCSERLAELAGFSAKHATLLRYASQMHDVGKIGIPDNVLLKPGRFDDDERTIMERHCEIGARILTGVDTPLTVMARTIAITHHEKWDGSGYPHRLAGNDIPIEGRITAICDVFDALLSSRPYKQGWAIEKVEAFLREQSGRHFDPTLTTLFLDHFQDFLEIRENFRDEATPEELVDPG